MKLIVDTDDMQFGPTRCLILGYLRVNPKASMKDIAGELQICRDMVYRHIRELEDAGKIKRHRFGRQMLGAEVYD